MATIVATNTKAATGNAHRLEPVAAPVIKTHKQRLVARWFTDENSKLYCRWITED